MRRQTREAQGFLAELGDRLASAANWSHVGRDMQAQADRLPQSVRTRIAARLLHRLLLAPRDMPRVEREVFTSIYHHLVNDAWFDQVDFMGLLTLATDSPRPDWTLLVPAVQKFADFVEHQPRLSPPFRYAWERFIATHGTALPREATTVIRHILLFFSKVDRSAFGPWVAALETRNQSRHARMATRDMSRTNAVLRACMADDLRRLVGRHQQQINPALGRRLAKVVTRLGGDRAVHGGFDLAAEARPLPNGSGRGDVLVDYFQGVKVPNPSDAASAYLDHLLELETWEQDDILGFCEADWVHHCFIKVEDLSWPAAYAQVLEVSRVFGPDADRALDVLVHLSLAHGASPSPRWLVRWAQLSANVPAVVGLSLCETLAAIPDQAPDLISDDVSVAIVRGALWGMTMWRHTRTPRFLADLITERVERSESWLSTCQGALKALELIGTPEALNELVNLRDHAEVAPLRRHVQSTLNRIASARGLETETLMDLAVDRCGLDRDASRTWAVPPSSRARLWLDAQGRLQRGVFDAAGQEVLEPQATFVTDEVPGLRAQIDEASDLVRTVYDAQKARLEQALSLGRTWRYEVWRQIFTGHPVMAHLASRLVWRVDLVGPPRYFLPDGADGWIDSHGQPVRLHPEATLSLAHPATARPEPLQQWRENLVRERIVQPLKQLFREAYQPESETELKGPASSRFAGRVARFVPWLSFLQTRGWRVGTASHQQTLNELQKEFPPHGIRALVDVRPGEHGDVVVQAIIFRHTATHTGSSGASEAMKTGEIVGVPRVPLIVYSETMRDLDMALSSSFESDATQASVRPERWTARREDLLMSPQGQDRGNLLRPLVEALGWEGRVAFTGGLAEIRSAGEDLVVHLGTGTVYRNEDGSVMTLDTRALDSVYLPFEEEDAATRAVVSKVLFLASQE